jgi:ABC-type uncharacterized transport system YnjBCD permease subunit
MSLLLFLWVYFPGKAKRNIVYCYVERASLAPIISIILKNRGQKFLPKSQNKAIKLTVSSHFLLFWLLTFHGTKRPWDSFLLSFARKTGYFRVNIFFIYKRTKLYYKESF